MGNHTDHNYRYYINKHGEKVRRVSDVIKILAKESITVWANMLGLKGIKYKDELERTANIGSLCHDVLEHYFNPNMLASIDYEDYGIESEEDKLAIRKALDSFFAWYKEFTKHHAYHVKFTELVVVGEELGGTIDCGIEGFKDPNKVIFVDYKTSKDFYLTQFLQLAAYVMLYEEVYGPDTVEGVMVVCLNKSGGKCKARFLSREKMGPFISCFQCMFDVAVATKILDSGLRELTEVM